MRKLMLVAALVLLSSSAHAAGHDFRFGGRVIHVDVPKNCKSISCIHVGAKEKPARASRRSAEPEPVNAVAAAAAAAPVTAATIGAASVPAAPVAAPAPQSTATAVSDNSKTDDRKPVARLSLPAPEETRPAQVATAQPQPETSSPAEPAVKPAGPSPLGVWVTEKGEGKVRIEECGQALCGHTEGRPNERILINMQPGGKNRWNGKIHDIRSGSTYMSHMALRGANALRVEGCAFGGLFCGGQTWTRVQ